MTITFELIEYKYSWLWKAATGLFFVTVITIASLLYAVTSNLFVIVSTLLIYLLFAHIDGSIQFRNKGFIEFYPDHIRINFKDSMLTYRLDNIRILKASIFKDNVAINVFGRFGGYIRYHNLYHSNVTPQFLDRILINEETYYLKIRSKEELALFEDVIKDINKGQIYYIKHPLSSIFSSHR